MALLTVPKCWVLVIAITGHNLLLSAEIFIPLSCASRGEHLMLYSPWLYGGNLETSGVLSFATKLGRVTASFSSTCILSSRGEKQEPDFVISEIKPKQPRGHGAILFFHLLPCCDGPDRPPVSLIEAPFADPCSDRAEADFV